MSRQSIAEPVFHCFILPFHCFKSRQTYLKNTETIHKTMNEVFQTIIRQYDSNDKYRKVERFLHIEYFHDHLL